MTMTEMKWQPLLPPSELAWLSLLQTLSSGLGPVSILAHVQGQDVSWHLEMLFMKSANPPGAFPVRRHFMIGKHFFLILV